MLRAAQRRRASGPCPRQGNVFSALIVAKSQINRLAQLSITRQFLVRDLRDELRSKIRDVMLARRVHERRLAADERLKLFVERRKRLAIEARAHLADVVKRTALVGSEQQGTEVLARALGQGVPHNHEFVLLVYFHLQ